MPFEKIESKKKSIYISEQIIKAVKEGEYVRGDKLPPEREIAKQMNVSRNSVREAITALQIVGIVDSKAGEGTFVVNDSFNNRLNREQFLVLLGEGADLLEIWRAREGIETCLAHLAVNRANSAKTAQVRDILDEMEEVKESGDYQHYLQTNRDFHLAIADLADNPPLKRALKSLLKVSFQISGLLGDIERGYSMKHQDRTLNLHKNIIESIENRDLNSVNKYIKTHFQELIDYLKKEFIYISKNN